MNILKRLVSKKVSPLHQQHSITPNPQEEQGPDLLLLLVDREPPRGADLHISQLIAELPSNLKASTIELHVTNSYKDQYFIGTTANFTAIKRNFKADLNKLHYRHYSTADGVNGTMVFVYRQEV